MYYDMYMLKKNYLNHNLVIYILYLTIYSSQYYYILYDTYYIQCLSTLLYTYNTLYCIIMYNYLI